MMIRRKFLQITGVTALALPAVSCARVDAPSTMRREFSMDIKRVGTQSSSKGPPDWFTGSTLQLAGPPQLNATITTTYLPEVGHAAGTDRRQGRGSRR